MNVYLDNAASTKTDERVLEAMLPYLKEHYGNPSSTHRQGKLLKVLIEESREAIADFFGTKPKEIFFTSGGTESNNFAIKGLAFINGKGSHYITSSTEHPAVLDTFTYLRKFGYDTEIIKPNSEGLITREILEPHLKENTKLVSVMHANNETGTVNDIKSISELCKSFGAAFHSDTVQSVGKTSVKPKELGIDFLTVSAHKIYGPKGIGAVYINDKVKITNIVKGSNNENGIVKRTMPSELILSFAKAVELLNKNYEKDMEYMQDLKEYFAIKIEKNIDNVKINSLINNEKSNPKILNVSFLGVKGEILLHTLEQKGIFVSTGSACSSKKKGSRVLESLDLSLGIKDSAIRFSFSKNTTDDELQFTVEVLKKEITKLRKLLNYK